MKLRVCVRARERESECSLGERLVRNQTRAYSETRPHTCAHAPSLARFRACVNAPYVHMSYMYMHYAGHFKSTNSRPPLLSSALSLYLSLFLAPPVSAG